MSDGDEAAELFPRSALPRKVARLIDASVEIQAAPADRPDYLHTVLCQVGMPRSKHDGLSFERTSGNVSLRVEAGKLWDGGEWQQQPLPYGVRPRLAMIHISSEAVRTQSPKIEVGHSVRDFLLKIGMDTGGRGYAAFRQQMTALAACRLRMGLGAGDRAVTVEATPIRKFDAWLHPTGNQRTLWPGQLELTDDFFATLMEHAVPLDHRALAALARSALAIDTYTWLAYRLCRVRQAEGTKVSWSALREQFGTEYGASKDFKREFRRVLREVQAVYPEARIEEFPGGLVLKSSPSPIAKAITSVGIKHGG
jgi:hypothetical protein